MLRRSPTALLVARGDEDTPTVGPMSVYVTVMPAAIPHVLRDENPEREIRYDDTETKAYVFEILASGALVVWRGEHDSDVGRDIEVIYGPTAWNTVQGTPRRDTL